MSPWPFMHHVSSSYIFRYGKYGLRKGWTFEKSTLIELKCRCMMCVILSPYNLGKLLFVKQLVHEQQKNYVVIVSLNFLQIYLH
jgi:hypothetical protein